MGGKKGGMRLQYTKHARDRMAERSVTKAEIEATIAKPIRRIPRQGTKAKLIGRPGGRHIMVVVDFATDPPTVITAGD